MMSDMNHEVSRDMTYGVVRSGIVLWYRFAMWRGWCDVVLALAEANAAQQH